MDVVDLNKYKVVDKEGLSKKKIERMKQIYGSHSMVQNIYHYLWSKNQLFLSGPQIYLPDTIIYNYQQPAFWYFTSTKPKEDPYAVPDMKPEKAKKQEKKDKKIPRILKKSQGKLSNKEIEKAFLKKGTIGPSGIVAVYFYYKPRKGTQDSNLLDALNAKSQIHNHGVGGNHDCNEQAARNIDPTHKHKQFTENIMDKKYGDQTYFEFLDEKMFKEFLYERVKPYDGILQKFIDPDTIHNVVYRINWSPKLCLFEKRTNKLLINQRAADPYERSCTYEGSEIYSQSQALRGEYLTQQMQKQANSLAYHISNLTFELKIVDRMVLNFKCDKNGQLWFLWCSGLRLKLSEQPSDNAVKKPPLHKNMILKQQNSLQIGNDLGTPTNLASFSTNQQTLRNRSIQKSLECPNCKKFIQADDGYEVTFKMIIRDFEQRNMEKIRKLQSERDKEREAAFQKTKIKFCQDQQMKDISPKKSY